ncbi:MAG: hypothetical protein GQ574_07790 [Crocinitomix sp.]|nr:hypothetical protein [Crocinitomix sp.]
MKRKIYAGLSIALIGMALIACEKDLKEEINVEPAAEKPIEERIGEYHNFALNLYLVNEKDLKKTTDLQEVRNQLMDLLTEAKPEVFIADDMQALDFDKLDKVASELAFFNRSEDRTELDPETYNFEILITDLEITGEISPDLTTELLNINDLVMSEVASEEILASVNNIAGMSWTGSDVWYANTFVDVFNESTVFWHSPETLDLLTPDQLATAMDDTDKVILADAGGALYGLLLGPVGSIVYGAAFSIIANHS